MSDGSDEHYAGSEHGDELPADYYILRAQSTPHGAPSGSGRGSWAWTYEYKADPFLVGEDQFRYAAGVRGYSTLLILAGYSAGVKPDLPLWGNYKRDRTIEFQRSVGLGADGVVGPHTARELLRPLVVREQERRGIPESLLGKQMRLESNCDIVAEGWSDPDDEGAVQMHMAFHPDWTTDLSDPGKKHVWDPQEAIPWMGGQLWSNHANLRDYDAALAAYNAGYSTAKAWLAAGKPASGGPIWSGGIDSFERCHTYVALVRATVY